ncbi:MAG: hypothetical protein ACK55I_02380, partial [bacterium]
PGLVEDDAVVEELRAVEDDTLVMEKAQQCLGGTDATDLFTEGGELLLAEAAVLALRDRHQLIGLAPGFQLLPHQVAAPADGADAIAVAEVGVGVGQGVFEGGGTAPGLGTEAQGPQAPEAFQKALVHRRHAHRLGGGVALALHHQHGRVGA